MNELSYWSVDPAVKSLFVTKTVSDLILYSSNANVVRHLQLEMAAELAANMYDLKHTDYCVIVEPPHPRASTFSTDYTVIGIPGEYQRLKTKIEDLERSLMVERSRNSTLSFPHGNLTTGG